MVASLRMPVVVETAGQSLTTTRTLSTRSDGILGMDRSDHTRYGILRTRRGPYLKQGLLLVTLGFDLLEHDRIAPVVK